MSVSEVIDANDFDSNMQHFYVGLAEQHWDKAVITLLNMSAIVHGKAKDSAAERDADLQQCRADILKDCERKIKTAVLAELQKFIDLDSPAEAVVIWEKTKVLGFADEASELYRQAFCRLVQAQAVKIMSRLQSTRALAGLTTTNSLSNNNGNDSLGDSEVSRKKYVSAVTNLLNVGYSKVQGILSYGLADDVDLSIALSVNDKMVRRQTSSKILCCVPMSCLLWFVLDHFGVRVCSSLRRFHMCFMH